MAGLPPKRETIDRKLVDDVAKVLANAANVLFITGAGMSADSGLPSYHGVGGLFERPLVDDGLTLEAVLSPAMLAQRPDVLWRYVHERELACRHTAPNRGHEVLALLGERIARTVIVTQNLDGLQRRAGAKRVIALHGDLHDLRCTACAWTTSTARAPARCWSRSRPPASATPTPTRCRAPTPRACSRPSSATRARASSSRWAPA
jgi:NAD-dependent SIR2 family protein deacetylase